MGAKIRVHRWLGVKKKKTYEVHGIYEDDTVERALAKMVLSIRRQDDALPEVRVCPYAWTVPRGRAPRILRFDVERAPHALDPWAEWERTSSRRSLPATRPVWYHEHLLLGSVREVHIVFASDLPTTFQAHPLYFPDASVGWKPPSDAVLDREMQSLARVWEAGKLPAQDAPGVTKARYMALAKLPPLEHCWERLQATSEAPFLQWVEDVSKIQYKLYEKHGIPLQALQTWTQYERVPRVTSISVFFVVKSYPFQYMRVCLEPNGTAVATLHTDALEHIPKREAEEQLQRAAWWLREKLQTPLIFAEDDLTVRVDLVAPTLGIPFLSGQYSKWPMIFHVLHARDGVLTMTCKRSAHYQERLDLVDFIQSRVRLGSNLGEIVEDLVGLGLSAEDIAFWQSQYLMLEDAEEVPGTAPRPKGPKKTLADTGCILRITRSSIGIRVLLEHAASFAEVRRILRWVQGVLQEAIQQLPGPSRPAPAAFTAPASPSMAPRAPQPHTPSPRSSPPIVPAAAHASPPLENVLEEGDLDDLLSGGAMGKEYARYFNTELKQADPALFKDVAKGERGYSSKCAANNFRQPVVMSREEKARLDATEYKEGYDDAVEYGSDDAHRNVYMCPRIWCPLSRIPLTPAQLQAHHGVCPAPHFEKPLLMYEDRYWGFKPDAPHHIGFLKARTSKGLCLPCCMTHPIKPQQRAQCLLSSSTAPHAPSKKKVTAAPTPMPGFMPSAASSRQPSPSLPLPKTVVEEFYIMGAPPPLPKDRAGLIPRELHDTLLPNVSHVSCSKAVNSTPCFVRRGMGTSSDAWMSSVATALRFDTKKAWLLSLRKLLDPITFIALENGHVLRAFAPLEAIDPSTHPSMEAERKAWRKKWTTYAKRFPLDEEDPSQVSRELALYAAYKAFWDHLQSDEPKNPQHLMDLLLRQGILLLVWNRSGASEATLLCPYFQHAQSLLSYAQAPENKGHLLMLLHERGQVEPLELRARGKKGAFLIPVADMPHALTPLASCPATQIPGMALHPFPAGHVLHSLFAWMNMTLQNPETWIVRELLLASDLSPYALWLRNGILLLFPPEQTGAGVLSRLVDILPPSARIRFHEDVAGSTAHVRQVAASELLLVATKLRALGWGMDAGTQLNLPGSAMVESLVTLPPPSPTTPPVLWAVGRTPAAEARRQKQTERRWWQLQQKITAWLLATDDKTWKRWKKMPRPELHDELLASPILSRIPHPQMLRVLLEQMPLRDGKEALEAFARAERYEQHGWIYGSAAVHHERHQVRFSQAAVDAGLPWYDLAPKKGPRPLRALQPDEARVHPMPEAPQQLANIDRAPLPLALDPMHAQAKSLPSKFTQMRQYSWVHFRMLMPSTGYDPARMWEVVAWLAQKHHFVLLPSDVAIAHHVLVAGLLETEAGISLLLEDPSFTHAWAQAAKQRKWRKPAELGKDLRAMSPAKRLEAWRTQVIPSGKLTWSDVDWYVVSQIMGIHILILKRSKYGAQAQASPHEDGARPAKPKVVPRGDLKDLSFSSLFLMGAPPHARGNQWRQRPCILLYKENREERSEYLPIVSQTGEFYHPSLASMPKDIQDLVDFHVQQNTHLAMRA